MTREVPIALPIAPDIEHERLRPGQIWSLDKDGRTLTCVLHQQPHDGWQLRLELDGKLLRVDACHNDKKAGTLIARWQHQAMRKGWSAPT